MPGRQAERARRARRRRPRSASRRPGRSFSAPPPSPIRACEKSRSRIGTRAPPTSAVSCRRSGSMVKFSSLTVVAPAVSEMPPLWRIVPLSRAANGGLTIGNESSPRRQRRGGRDRGGRDAEAGERGDGARVELERRGAVGARRRGARAAGGLARTVAVPSSRPSVNAVVPNAWLSAPAAAAVSFRRGAGERDRAAGDVGLQRAQVDGQDRHARAADERGQLRRVVDADLEVGQRDAWWRPWLSAIPPLWVIVPANVLASSLPPVIGNASESPPIGAAVMPRLCSAARGAWVERDGGRAAGQRDGLGLRAAPRRCRAAGPA